MKKVLLFIFGITALTLGGFAQKGNNQVSPALEVALPTGDASDVNKIGLGVTVKGMYGMGEAGQVTFTTGYLVAGGKNDYKDLLGADKINSIMIPLLAGYRHHFGSFFAEPQVGYGIYGVKVKGGSYDSNDSEGAFTWAAGLGYSCKNLEASVRYQSMHKNGANSGFFGVRLGYLFSIGAGK